MKERLVGMISQNYECAAMYVNDLLIGIYGIGYMTRHYIGKSMGIDHIIIDRSH